MKVLAWVTGALGAALAAFLLLNAFDETLDPQAQALLRLQAPQVPEEENAWYPLVGLAALPAEDPPAYGREWTQAALAVRTAQDADAFSRRFDGRRLPVPTSPKDVADARLQVLLERYARLADYRGYAEPELRSQYSPLPFGASYGYGWAREKTLEGALLGSANFNGALKVLWRDVDLQRTLLSGSSLFVSKAVFTMALARDYLAASALIQAQPAAARKNMAALRELLSPLKAELDMTRPVASEVRFLVRVAEDQRFPRSVLAQRNATANSAARAAAAALEFRDRESFAARLASLSAGLKLRNPLGETIAMSGWQELGELLARMHDLEALRRLVALQAESLGGSEAEIPASVQRSADGRHASFQPVSERFKALARGGRIAVELRPPTSR